MRSWSCLHISLLYQTSQFSAVNTRTWTDTNSNFPLRVYGRLKYDTPDVGSIVASAKRSRPAAPKRPKRRLWLGVRYFLNAYRGFAAFDLKGHRDSEI